MAEATPEFKRRLREAIEEMHVGQTFSFRRTFTGGDVAMFCGVTGDYKTPTTRTRRSRSRASTGG